jgi:hypothetical protein
MTPQDVLERLTDAARVIAASERREGPASLRAFFPEGTEPGDYPKGITMKFRPSSSEVSRAEESMSWLKLVEDETKRRMLSHFALCRATEGKWARTCRKFGWKRTTARSAVNAAAKEILQKLYPVSATGLDTTSSGVRHFEALQDLDLDTVQKCATHWMAPDARTELEFFGTDPDPNKWARERAERLRRKKLGAEIEEEFEQAPSRAR